MKNHKFGFGGQVKSESTESKEVDFGRFRGRKGF